MNAEHIVNYLEMVSNKNVLLNVIMHIVVLLAIASVFFVKNVRVRGLLFVGSIFTFYLSISINALIYGNPFHLITFGILTALTFLQLFRKDIQIVPLHKGFNIVVATAFIFIGLWYPEFVDANVFEFLLLSPVGIVPCPTMLVTLGLMTLCYPNFSKTLYLAAIINGLIYGLIGTFILKVYLDFSLLLAAVYSIYRLFYTRGTRANINGGLKA